MAEYLFRYLVTYKDSYTIESPVGSGTVHLTVPWTPVHTDKPLGTREFILDPRKGFLPIRGKAQWESKLSDGSPFWREEAFVVERSELVGEVWMPTKLKEYLRASSGDGENTISIWEIEVTKIESGKVRPADLEIVFPARMQVVDAIQGESYVVGADGERTRVQPLVGVLPGSEIQPRAVLKNRLRLVLAMVFLLASVILGGLVGRRALANRQGRRMAIQR
jgi:hypothetical protein